MRAGFRSHFAGTPVPLAVLLVGLTVAGCDRAIDDRYGGLVIVPTQEETAGGSAGTNPGTDTAETPPSPQRSQSLGQITAATPPPRPTRFPPREMTPQEAQAEATLAEEQAILAEADASLAEEQAALAEAEAARAAEEAARIEAALAEAEASLAEAEAALASEEFQIEIQDQTPDVDPARNFQTDPSLFGVVQGSLAALRLPEGRPNPFPQSFDALEAFNAAQARRAAEEAERLAAERQQAQEAERRAQEAARLAAERAAQQAAERAAAQAAALEAAAQAEALAALGQGVETGFPGEGTARSTVDKSLFLPLRYTGRAPLETAADLQKVQSDSGLDLAQIIAGEPVPPLILQRFPQDWSEFAQGDRVLRNSLFVKAVLPLCLLANDRILAERRYVLGTQDTVENLEDALDPALRGLAAKYKAQSRSELLARIDSVPTSLCLAQAILESQWGDDPNLASHNALFGPWRRDGENRVKPSAQIAAGGGEDTDSPLILFASLQAATEAYMLHLNRDPAFTDFRMQRTRLQGQDGVMPGLSAVSTVGAYAPDRDSYGDLLEFVIRDSQLDQFDLTRLGSGRTPVAVF